jgi:hypothetical protein
VSPISDRSRKGLRPDLFNRLVIQVHCDTRITFSGGANRSWELWWLARYDALKAFLEKNGGKYPVKGDPTRLGEWIIDQRTAYRKGLKRLSADPIELLEKLRGWTWNAKVGKPSNTAATGIQARPKKRRLSEACMSNEAIGDASETCSDIEVVLEDIDEDDDHDVEMDVDASDSSGWDDIVIELNSDEDE